MLGGCRKPREAKEFRLRLFFSTNHKLKMKLLITIIASLLLVSCTPKLIGLKGSYPVTPIQINSDKDFEEVWSNIIDLFAQKGLSIKLIDKNSGIIISDKTIFKTTIENKDGSLKDTTAYLVVGQIYDYGSSKLAPINSNFGRPADTYGEWNIRIKKNDKGGTSVNVNITNVYYAANDKYGGYSLRNISMVKTTGVFERQISNIVK